VLHLAHCNVHSTDDSFFSRPHAFQIISISPKSKQIYNFLVSSPHEKKEWIAILRHHTNCCSKCTAVWKARDNYGGFGDETFKIVRNLTVGIIQARGLPNIDTRQKTVSPYAVILLDDVKQAKTAVKNSNDPIWGEVFELE